MSSEGEERGREEEKEENGTNKESRNKQEEEPVVNGSHLEPLKISNGLSSSGEVSV